MSMYVTTRYDGFMATATVECDSIDEIDLRKPGFRIDFVDQLEAASYAVTIGEKYAERVEYEKTLYTDLEAGWTGDEVTSPSGEVAKTNGEAINYMKQQIAAKILSDEILAKYQQQVDAMYPLKTNAEVIAIWKNDLSELARLIKYESDGAKKEEYLAEYNAKKTKLNKLEKPIKELEYGKNGECDLCQGKKTVCKICGGTGWYHVSGSDEKTTCVYCGGTGRPHDETFADTCPKCNGSGIDEHVHLPGIEDLITTTSEPFLTITNDSSDIFCNADDETLIRNGMQYWVNEDKKSMTFRFIPQLNTVSCETCSGTGLDPTSSELVLTCENCKGKGETTVYDGSMPMKAGCTICDAEGFVTASDTFVVRFYCDAAGGYGYLSDYGDIYEHYEQTAIGALEFKSKDAAAAKAAEYGITDYEIQNRAVCYRCGGHHYYSYWKPIYHTEQCDMCDGKGEIKTDYHRPCLDCHGTGNAAIANRFRALICMVAFDYQNIARFEISLIPRLITGDIEKAGGPKVEDPVLGLGTWSTTDYDLSAKETIIVSHPTPAETVKDGKGELPRPEYEWNSELDKDHLYVNNTPYTESLKTPLYICKSSAYLSTDLIDEGYVFDWTKFKSDLYDVAAQTAVDIPCTVNGLEPTGSKWYENLSSKPATVTLVPTYTGTDPTLTAINTINLECYEIVQSISSESDKPVYSQNQLRCEVAI